ncbi:MAG: hypothetical protein WD534_00140 [Phycisphaeraceae bacterium]
MTQQAIEQPGETVRVPWTLWIGLALWGVAHALLWVDVMQRGGVLMPYDVVTFDELPEPVGRIEQAGRWMAVNVTPVCWLAYLLVADGALTWLARRRAQPQLSSIRSRPNRFAIAWLTSIPVWCFFDWINFYWMDAWRYHGLPDVFTQRLLGYFLAFAAISPGMFMAAQFWQQMGLRRLRLAGPAPTAAWALTLGPPTVIVTVVMTLLLAGRGVAGPLDSQAFAVVTAGVLVGPAAAALLWRQPRETVAVLIGLSFLAWTLIARDPLSNLTLWVGLIYLLDPLNGRLGMPSLLRDWGAGRFGRTAALFAGGATCGLLWELWNYWALTKWTYHLPFLGRLEQWSYFEMPLLGFLGFLPFAAECWVVLNTILAGFAWLGLRVAERLPDEEAMF